VFKKQVTEYPYSEKILARSRNVFVTFATIGKVM